MQQYPTSFSFRSRASRSVCNCDSSVVCLVSVMVASWFFCSTWKRHTPNPLDCKLVNYSRAEQMQCTFFLVHNTLCSYLVTSIRYFTSILWAVFFCFFFWRGGFFSHLWTLGGNLDSCYCCMPSPTTNCLGCWSRPTHTLFSGSPCPTLLPFLFRRSPQLHLHTLIQPCYSASVGLLIFSDFWHPSSFPPPSNLLQGLGAGQQGLLQLANAALQLVNLFVALLQLTTQLLRAEQQLTAPICLLLQLWGQPVHLVERERGEEKCGEWEKDKERKRDERNCWWDSFSATSPHSVEDIRRASWDVSWSTWERRRLII